MILRFNILLLEEVARQWSKGEENSPLLGRAMIVVGKEHYGCDNKLEKSKEFQLLALYWNN